MKLKKFDWIAEILGILKKKVNLSKRFKKIAEVNTKEGE